MKIQDALDLHLKEEASRIIGYRRFRRDVSTECSHMMMECDTIKGITQF
jgi:hypothetical protein